MYINCNTMTKTKCPNDCCMAEIFNAKMFLCF